MERRQFLLLAFGAVAGGAALAATANAAPLPPALPQHMVTPRGEGVKPAVVSQDEVDHLKPEQVRWHHHGHWHRRWHRHWHRRWHHRHWGWRRHHWHRHWHHRHWR